MQPLPIFIILSLAGKWHIILGDEKCELYSAAFHENGRQTKGRESEKGSNIVNVDMKVSFRSKGVY